MLDAAHNLELPARERESSRPRGAALPSGSRPAWCVVATHPKAERRAHASLHHFGFDAYLPLITVRWRDRSWHTGPLWPGYVFVQLDLGRPWHPVTHAPGVFQLLSIDGAPSICPDTIISLLQATEAERASPTRETASWAPGALCALGNGSLRGHPAVVLRVARETAHVSVMIFGGLREVQAPVSWLMARE
jgi:transcription antitermination factor NusG